MGLASLQSVASHNTRGSVASTHTPAVDRSRAFREILWQNQAIGEASIHVQEQARTDLDRGADNTLAHTHAFISSI